MFCRVTQRFQDRRTSVSTTAARSRILTSPSPWWCGDGPSTTASTCSSRVSWSPLWLCLSSFCLLTLGRRSHWVRSTHTNTLDITCLSAFTIVGSSFIFGNMLKYWTLIAVEQLSDSTINVWNLYFFKLLLTLGVDATCWFDGSSWCCCVGKVQLLNLPQSWVNFQATKIWLWQKHSIYCRASVLFYIVLW